MTWHEIIVNANLRGSFSDDEYKLAASLLNDPIAEKGKILLGESFNYCLHSKWDYLSEEFFRAVRENNFQLTREIITQIDQLTVELEERQKCTIPNCDNDLAHKTKVFIELEGAYVSDIPHKDVKYWEVTHKEMKPLMVLEPPTQYFTNNPHPTVLEETIEINKKQSELGFPPIAYHPFDENSEYGRHSQDVKGDSGHHKEKLAKHIPIEMLKLNSAIKIIQEENETFEHLAMRVRAAVANFLKKNSHWELTTRSFPDEQTMRVYRSK